MLNDIDSDKISLSYTNAFVEDLAQSDFLISFSSTTIEEAILLNKKILLLTFRVILWRLLLAIVERGKVQ